ncbi:MAG: hypothetical protein KH135_00030 [Firmicutes bacterium]|nr:hypothetical protein [Bacillota bacterium]
MKEEDIHLAPFTLNLNIEGEMIVEKSKPIPFNETKISELTGVTYLEDEKKIQIEEPGDYYLSFQLQTDKTYFMSIESEADFFSAELFPVAGVSHGSGVLTVLKPNTTFFLTCHISDVKLVSKNGATLTVFKVRPR